MKLHRFFVREEINYKAKEISISDSSVAHQMKYVLRLHKNDEVIILDGSGIEFHGRIKILTKHELVIAKIDVKKVERKQDLLNVHLFVSLIKKDKFEWVLQKVTELGVTRITPVLSERTEKQKINMDRADKIIIEACEQSGRVDYPFLDAPISLKEALSICETAPIVLDMNGEMIDVKQLKESSSEGSQVVNVSLFIGPEGGWDKKDWEQFEKSEVKRMSVGSQVLRAETASIAVSSLLLLG